MRTRNLATRVESAPVQTTRTRGKAAADVNVLISHKENTPAKSKSGRATGASTSGAAKKIDKENVASLANQEPTAGRKRGRPPKIAVTAVQECLAVAEAQPPALKKHKVAADVPAPTGRSTRTRGKESSPVEPQVTKKATRKVTESVTENPPVPIAQPQQEGITGRGRRGKFKEIIEESVAATVVVDAKEAMESKTTEKVSPTTIPDKEIIAKPPKRTTGRRKGATAKESDKKEQKEIVEQQKESTVEKVADPPKSTTITPQLPPVPPTQSVAITNNSTNTTPAIPITATAAPQTLPVPFQRSPVYLTDTINKSATPSSPPTTPLQSVQNKSVTEDDPFRLMPLKPTRKRQPTKPTPTVPSVAPATDLDDVYGFDFNESTEPTKAKAAAKKKRVTKPKQPRQPKAKKPTEPSGPKLWDDKGFNQRQRQIKVNVINKDFKPQEKPIPPPTAAVAVPPFRPRPQVNVTQQVTPPEIQISEIHFDEPPTGSNSTSNKLPQLVGNISSSSSKLMPWRYSTIRSNASMGNVTMTSLNDSNAENVHPGTGPTKAVPLSLARPLHTLQPQRSPMKELNPNETILVPRPRVKKRSPVKRPFGVENNFGFDSDNEENNQEGENLEVKRKRINEKIDSLKRFRHSLNATNSSSPVVMGPMRVVPVKERVLPKQVTAVRNIFTSTPQQTKIRDAFKASTPIAGPSRQQQLQQEIEKGSGDGPTDEGHKLFESLTFEAPAKRNYSSMVPRRKKKVDFYGFSDDEVSDDENAQPDESGNSPTRRPKVTKKAKVVQVQEEKLAKFVDEFNSMCEEVDQYELVIE